MLTEKTIKLVLEKLDLPLTDEQLAEIKTKAQTDDKSLEEILISDGLVEETALYKGVAELFNTPFTTLKGKEIDKDNLAIIPSLVAGTHQVVSFDKTDTELLLAMTDPTDIQTIEFLHRKTGLNPKVFVTTPSDLKDALHKYHAELKDEFSSTTSKKVATDGDLKKAAEEVSIIKMTNSILEHAVYEGASDIHIEPEEKDVNIRYRIDGILKNVMVLPKNVQNGLTARIKILSNLKLDEHMIPQDGRFKVQIQDEHVAFRVSILPVYDGEKIVMRLLHEGAKPLTLDQLGFLESSRQKLENAIKKPHGMILVTGPTGSGKTTTLYSVLGILNQPGVNISTVEDPIEYRVAGVNQSQMNAKVGFTFASGLRALLRQDPNIIMVGEIRDQETAEISINAAMTGHLVLSTLHTNDAPTTLPRLVDMGVPPFLVAYTTNIIIAQRLVRRICQFCKTEFTLEGAALDELARTFDIKKLSDIFEKNIKDFSSTANNLSFFRGEGCNRCGQTGYKGRQGIYEVMEIDEGLVKKINERATSDDIKKYAREHGMLTMLEDGLIKAKMGVTSIAEILRVTKE